MAGDHHSSCVAAADAWQSALAAGKRRCLVGFDGFVDHIIDVVDKRMDRQNYEAMPTIASFGERIQAAAGQSANFELAVQQTKIGGNGPIMANALAQFGQGVTYLGIIGGSEVDPVFAPLAEAAEAIIGLGQPAVTDALEFTDGKLMLGKLTPLEAINYDSIVKACGAERLRSLLAEVDGVATVNWTMTLSMTDIWRSLAKEVLPGLSAKRQLWFVDLADPAKRTTEDLADALQAMQELQAHVDVVLGMNGSEARQVLSVLGGAWEGDPEDTAAAGAAAEAIREKMGIHCAMVHLVGSAAAATADAAATAAGFHCDDPVITTGAGDHFNAGFFTALLHGVALEQCLLVGGATSGSYVRSARSPQPQDIVHFLRAYPDL